MLVSTTAFLYIFFFGAICEEVFQYKLFPSHSKERPLFYRYIELIPIGDYIESTIFHVEKFTEEGTLIESENVTTKTPMIEISAGKLSRSNYTTYGPEYIRISAYSEEGELLARGADEFTVIYWDFRYALLRYDIEFEEDEEHPGCGTLSAIPVGSLDEYYDKQTRIWQWRRVAFTDTIGCSTTSYLSLGDFELDKITTGKNSLYHCFVEPGVYYLSVQGYQMGGSGGTQAGGYFTYNLQPSDESYGFLGFAVTVCFDHPTDHICPSLLDCFGGKNYTMQNTIPNDLQLPLTQRDIVVTEDLAIAVWKGMYLFTLKTPTNLYLRIPDVISLDEICSNTATTTEDGYTTYNVLLSSCSTALYDVHWLWFNFSKNSESEEELVLGQTYILSLKYDTGAWQDITITPIQLEKIKRLPKRIITWYGYSQYGMWRSMESYVSLYGYNTIIRAGYGVYYDIDDPSGLYIYVTPEKRTELQKELGYEKIYYGGRMSLFQEEDVTRDAYNLMNDLERTDLDLGHFPSSLTPEEIVSETLIWNNSINFFIETGEKRGINDIAYNGAIYRRHLELFGTYLDFTKPDFVALNIERFCTKNNYYPRISDSQNAQNRRLPGETDETLHRRIIDEMFSDIYSEISDHSLQTRTSWFASQSMQNLGYPFTYDWDQYRDYLIGSMPQPYYYFYGKDSYVVRASVRGNRAYLSKSDPSADGLVRFFPVVSFGCWGFYDPDFVIDWMIQTFFNGADGFILYKHNHITDVRYLLKVREFIEWITPYEDFIMDGEVLSIVDVLEEENIIVGVIRKEDEYLIGITPDHNNPWHEKSDTFGYFNLSYPYQYPPRFMIDITSETIFENWSFDEGKQQLYLHFDVVEPIILHVREPGEENPYIPPIIPDFDEGIGVLKISFLCEVICFLFLL